MQSLANKKNNWPVYYEYLSNKYHGMPDLLRSFKAYYFDEQSYESAEFKGFGFVKILLSADITDDLLDSVREEFSKKTQFEKFELIRDILDIQMRYGFHNNSLFQHQEARIIDKLGFYNIDWLDYYKENYKPKLLGTKSIEYYMAAPVSFNRYIRCLTNYSQNENSRSAEIWAARIQCVPPRARIKESSIILETNLLGMEAINRFPNCFDESLVEIANIIHTTYSAENTPKNVKKYIGNLIESKFDQYLSEHCPGCRAYVCVNYDNAEQMNAMKKIVDVNTRPLCEPSQLQGRVYTRVHKGDTERVTENILHSLLDRGVVFDEIEEVEGTSLLCNRKLGISLRDSMLGFTGMPYNAIDFNSRYSAKQPAEWEKCFTDVEKLPNAIVIESHNGDWKVVDISSFAVQSVNDNPFLSKLASSVGSAGELAVTLSRKENYMRLMAQ